MTDIGERIASSSYEYKIGLLGKKNIAILMVYDKYITGAATEYCEGKFHEQRFNIPYETICGMEEKTIDHQTRLMIEYRSTDRLANRINFIIFPQMKDIENTIKALQERKNKTAADYRLQRKMRKKQEEEQLQKMGECRQFYQKCCDFHITDGGNRYYELYRDELLLFCIYVDKDKNINFLIIDGERREESNVCIPYGKIHYYERAGNVHYTTSINGSYSSFGESFTGQTFSKKRAIISGLLFGPLGMALGVVSSYKPAKAEMPNTDFSFSSATHRIDERSVILNYYSDTRDQYIDIELPAGIYNFLQTHFPEKKYDIVLEAGKQYAIRQNEKNGIDVLEPPRQKAEALSSDKNVDAFESRVKRLKIMRDNKLISDQEFEVEKSKLLKNCKDGIGANCLRYSSRAFYNIACRAADA